MVQDSQWHFTSAKSFFSQRSFVHLLADPDFIGISEQHTHTIAKHSHAVNGFLFIFLEWVQASLVPLLYRYIAIFTILSMARTSLASFMPSIYRYASIFAILRMALQSPHLIFPFPAIARKCD
jgi:hypothetical protein